MQVLAKVVKIFGYHIVNLLQEVVTVSRKCLAIL